MLYKKAKWKSNFFRGLLRRLLISWKTINVFLDAQASLVPTHVSQSLLVKLTPSDFHCLSVSGPLQSVRTSRDVICFLKAMTKSFPPVQKNTYLPPWRLMT